MDGMTILIRFLAALCLLLPLSAMAAPRVIHVIVALCDNVNQGIVPVPPKLGDGTDPANNLYWGAMYGVKTFLSKQGDWKRIETRTDLAAPLLERIIFKHIETDTYLVADAYDGAHIEQATTDFLDYAAGQQKQAISLGKQSLPTGGNAQLIVFIGHNGLMDFSLRAIPAHADTVTRDVAVFACQSRFYFLDILTTLGAQPLLLTTGNMAPEAYVLHAMATAWAKGETRTSIHDKTARAYHHYQKSGLNGSRRLFVID